MAAWAELHCECFDELLQEICRCLVCLVSRKPQR